MIPVGTGSMTRPGAGGDHAGERMAGEEGKAMIVKMYAYTTGQGTAMAETALCAQHEISMDYANLVLEAADGDWDGGGRHDCTGNEALACVVCGIRTDGSSAL